MKQNKCDSRWFRGYIDKNSGKILWRPYFAKGLKKKKKKLAVPEVEDSNTKIK